MAVMGEIDNSSKSIEGSDDQSQIQRTTDATQCENTDIRYPCVSDTLIDGKARECHEKDPDQSKLKELLRKLKKDPVYRHRLIHTLFVCWSFVGLGWLIGMIGPTFPDLRLIIEEDLGVSSWLFTAGSFGYLVGSVVGGILYDKLNKLLLLTVSSFGMGVAALLTPYCPNLWLMLSVRFITGVFAGGLDTGGNADVLHVWGSQSGPYMQGVHFGFSLGALISPLTTEPFLAKLVTKCGAQNISFASDSPDNKLTATSQSAYLDLPPSVPEFLSRSEKHVKRYISNISTNNTVIVGPTSMSCVSMYEQTSVHYAYLLASAIIFSSTLGYIYVYVRLKGNTLVNRQEVKEASKTDRSDGTFNRRNLSLVWKVTFLVLASILISGYCVVEDNFSSFFMTFGLEYLKWDKTTSALGTAVFWIAFALGRLFGIFIVGICRSTTMLTTYLVFLAVGVAGFLLSATFYIFSLIWVFNVILGFSMSVIFPAIFSWTSEHIMHVSGKVSGIFLTCASLTGLVFPLLIGNLMDVYDKMWFGYMLAIVMTFDLIVYMLMRVLLKAFPKERSNLELDIEVDTENVELK